MRRKRSRFLLLPLLFLSILSCKEGTPKVTIKWPVLEIARAEPTTGSAFMVILNDGDGGDAIVGCSLKEYPQVVGELHDIVGGRMQKVKEIKIPKRSTVELKPGTLHLMFFGLPENIDNKVTIVVEFKKSGRIETIADVKWY